MLKTVSKRINLLFLISILLFALLLRVYQLDKVPSSLFGDEVDAGYQAYSLFTTGKDLAGRTLPLYLKSLSEHRASLYIYSIVPFVGLFGLNEWGVRLPAVFWGILGVLGIYILLRKLFDSKTGLIGAFLLAISPWHLQYSRASFEVTMLLVFVIFGVYFFIRGIKNGWGLILSAIFFGLTVYIYSTAVVFSPLLIGILIFVYKKELLKLERKWLLSSIITTFLIVAPMFWFAVKGEASQRFSGVSIFQDTVLLDKVNLARKSQDYFSTDAEPRANNPQSEGLFHNKPLIYLQVFFVNYLKAFSFNFLFAEGDINFRHHIHEMGELYYFELILLLAGLWWIYKYAQTKEKLLISGWLLIAPIPGSLTADGGYHATRLILMLPPLVILNSLGLRYILSLIKSRYVKGLVAILVILFLFNFVFYLHRYFVHYPVESWRWWHIGFKESMLYMKNEEDNYSKLVFNNTYEPSLIRFLIWWQYPPEEIQKAYNNLSPRDDVLPGFNGFGLNDKYYFGSTKKGVSDFVKPEILYMVAARDEVEGDWDWRKSPPGGIKVLKTVVNPLNQPIFYVVTGQ